MQIHSTSVHWFSGQDLYSTEKKKHFVSNHITVRIWSLEIIILKRTWLPLPNTHNCIWNILDAFLLPKGEKKQETKHKDKHHVRRFTCPYIIFHNTISFLKQTESSLLCAPQCLALPIRKQTNKQHENKQRNKKTNSKPGT